MAERRDTRVVAGVGLILTVDDTSEPCMTRNLSRGGMFVVTRRIAPEGKVVGLEVIHHGKRLKARARVVKCADDGLGLSFTGADEEFRTAIRALMDAMVAERSIDPTSELSLDPSRDLKVAWGYPPDNKWWKVFGKKKQAAELNNLTGDGASLLSKSRPKVGDAIIVYLSSRSFEGTVTVESPAEVMRMTDAGFAVQFQAASIDFRRAVGQIRRTKFSRA
ncbi:MAG: PilZ domain-containing protein [Myxococcota bacterium]